MAKKKQKITKKTIKTTKPSLFSKAWFWGAIIALLGFGIYANTLGHDFALDDFSAIKDNRIVKKGLNELTTIWTTHYRYGYWSSAGELYRPLPLTMFAIEWQISPDNPFLHHLVNVLLYALTGLLLFLTLLKIFNKKWLLAFLGTALFIAHPVHTEIVANIKSRDEILAFLFLVISLNWVWSYIEKEKIGYLIGATLAYTIALFSKESAITFLALYPLFIYFFSRSSWKKIGIVTGVLLIPAILFLVVRSQVLSGFVTGGKTNSVLDNLLVGIDNPMDRIATTILLLGKYLWTMIFPHPLGSDFGYDQIPATSFGDWRVLLSLVIHLGLGGIAIWGFKQKHFLSFCVCFYAITFSIFSNVILEIGSSYGERFLYIPVLGFTLAIAYALQHFFPRATNAKGYFQQFKMPLLLGGILVGLYSVKTIERNPAWKDSYTLYATDIKTAPNSVKLNYHYALEASKKGQNTKNSVEKQQYYQAAKQSFTKAIQQYPSYADAYGQLGLLYYREGNSQEAFKNYQESIKYKTNNALVYSNMGILYFQNNDLENAKKVYQKAVEIDPYFVDARRNLGVVYAMQKNFPAAIEHFSAALKEAPNDATINQYLGSAYRDSGNASAGRPYLEKAEILRSKMQK